MNISISTTEYSCFSQEKISDNFSHLLCHLVLVLPENNDLTLPPTFESPKRTVGSNIEVFIAPLQCRNCKESIRLKNLKIPKSHVYIINQNSLFVIKKNKKGGWLVDY